ncbi:MAG: sulfatase-like hydrolase/transferase, partial [Deltaproteobacteria bacterium]|nr:sulfatase-like hydrolase/transferase [Deltaproteobacteria bacterium]
ALTYIEKDRGSPFFLYLAYTIPHAELAVPEDSQKPYLGKFPERPFKRPTSWEWRPGRYRPQENPKSTFAGMISRMDRDIGRLLTKLEEVGLDHNTLVVFASDNGAHIEGGAAPGFFGGSGPLRGVKRDLYEGGIRVPFIAHWPGKIDAGSISNHASASWDILPTFAELAGADPPEAIDGLSIAPTLLGQAHKQEEHEFLYWEFKEKRAARMGDWKVVHPGGENGALELYNLKSDVGEKHNLAGQHPEIIEEMKTRMNRSRTEPRDSQRRAR